MEHRSHLFENTLSENLNVFRQKSLNGNSFSTEGKFHKFCYVFQDNQGKQSKLILVSHGKQRLYPKELVPLERDNSSHLQYTFYVLRILNNPLRVFIGKRDSKNIKLKWQQTE